MLNVDNRQIEYQQVPEVESDVSVPMGF